MTYKEIITYLKPYALDPAEDGGVHGCPWYWGLEGEEEGDNACHASHNVSRRLSHGRCDPGRSACSLCWGRDADKETVAASMGAIQTAAARKKGGALTRLLQRIRG